MNFREKMGEQKKTKILAWVATITYILLAPGLILMAYLTLFLSDNPRISSGLVLFNALLYFCIPLSIPITLYLVWRNYFRKEYKRARWHCLDTLFVLIFVLLLSSLLLKFF